MPEKPTTYATNINVDLDKNPETAMSTKMALNPTGFRQRSFKVPSTSKPVSIGKAPDSKKNPIKQVEQIKDPNIKKPALESAKLTKEEILKTDNNGQWSLYKTASSSYYHIHQDGYRITDKPLHYSEIIKQHGSIKNLENNGLRLHPAPTPTPEKVEKKAPIGVDPDKHESCVMDVKAKGHDVGSAHAICSAAMKKTEDLKIYKNGQWDLEKVDWKGVKNKISSGVIAAAIGAASLGLGAGQAQAEMKPHTKFSHAYTNHAIQDEGMKSALSDIHGSGMVPIVHWDNETGDSKLILHDQKTKKPIMHFSDTKDGGYHMQTQKISPDKFSTIKDNAQKIHDHFVNFINYTQSKAKK